MKNIRTLLLILYIFFRFFAGVSVVLGLVLLLYTLISEFWFVVLYIPFVVVLGVLFSKIKLPNIIYKLGVLSLIVGFLGGVFFMGIGLYFMYQIYSEWK